MGRKTLTSFSFFFSDSGGAGMAENVEEGGKVTKLLIAIKAGDDIAKTKFFNLVYKDLKSIAAQKMTGQRAGHTLGVTGLVNEAVIRFMRGDFPADGEQHFFRVMNQAMRQILIDHSKARQARAGRLQRLPLDDLLDTFADE